MALKQAVALAIEQVAKAFPESEVAIREDGQGGAYVVVEAAPLAGFAQDATWIGFRITFQYPYADCYPHYVDAGLRRPDGLPPSGAGVQAGHSFEGRAAFQLSRRSNRLNPETDTALLKLEKVLRWLQNVR